MREVNYLVGNSKFSLDPFEPFSKDVCNFLNNLSNELNSVRNIKNYPDLKALSFWCRSKNILKVIPYTTTTRTYSVLFGSLKTLPFKKKIMFVRIHLF